MSKKAELKISISKDCGTCKHICFLENLRLDVKETARCGIFNKIVAKENKKKEIKYKNIKCKKWAFNYYLLDDCASFIYLKETKKINKKNK